MVPNGWEVKPLSNITKWSSGGTPSKNNPDYWNGEIPWISAASMRGHYFENSELKISDLAVSNGAKMAPKNSLLLLVRGSMLWNKIPVGIAARKVSFNQDVKCLVPHADELTTEFLLYWFLTYEHRLMNMVTGTGIGAGKLDTTDLQGLDVFLPPLPEQRKIAQILSTWDRGIATTEKLIDASKQQKKALMQQLLTGKKRLIDPETGKAFEGEWEEIRFDHCCDIVEGQVDPKDEPYANMPHIGPGNMEKFTGVLREYKSAKEDGQTSGKYLFEKKHVLYGKINPHFAKVCFPKFTGVCSADTYPIKVKGVLTCPKFLMYSLLSNRFTSYAVSVSARTGMPQINRNDLSAFKFLVPSSNEQQKIASVLTAADKEIELLVAKLAHFKQEKKALMQQLLTGKRRVSLSS
ncbi:restriction endonuclease subunit S [Photobacterium leiognathi subsp. mandapamensis]|uniref:restriction endonuclease subunit S n=1 Tax=Photobacterium leiognathi TaxID=553611 RepID=UPI003AF33DD6